MSAQQDSRAAAAIRQLHDWMARLPVDTRLWQIRFALSDVADRVVESACDPDSTILLALEVYTGIVRGCGGSEYELSLVRALHSLALSLQQHDRRPPAESRSETGPAEIFRPTGTETDNLSERPTIPRIPRAVAAQAQLPPELREITTASAFVCYLKQLMTHAWFSLRRIEEKTADLFPDATMRKSTLNDALNRTTLPTDEPALRSMFTVLYMQILDLGSAAPAVLRRVDHALAVWHHVQNPAAPSNGPCSLPASHPLIDTILATLHHAGEQARRNDDGDASGLAHAQRIVRDLPS
ncbi:hypothetical protein ACIQUM_20725 [Amycolatopsis azurea]|uniref:hypothetical protein n=1 Tax=Amycolatopsis azurea TaxID=36819 RepID=UPI00380F41D5